MNKEVTLPDHVNQFLKEKRLAEQKKHGERVEERQRKNLSYDKMMAGWGGDGSYKVD
jgi:hypothetical protein